MIMVVVVVVIAKIAKISKMAKICLFSSIKVRGEFPNSWTDRYARDVWQRDHLLLRYCGIHKTLSRKFSDAGEDSSLF